MCCCSKIQQNFGDDVAVATLTKDLEVLMNNLAGASDAEVLNSVGGAKGDAHFDSCGGTTFEPMTDLLTVVVYQAIKGPAWGRQ